MRKIVTIVFVLAGLFTQHTFAQISKKFDAYKMETDGYFTNISLYVYGIIATDNYASNLYMIHDGQIDILFSSAGCGRYYTLSPDKKKIGFKYITADGKQTPAILNIFTKKMTPLHSPVDLCGQVSFSNNGKVAFTIGNILYVKFESSEQAINLGIYSNIVSLSPDGNFAIYNNENDQLFLLDLNTGQSNQITDNATGYIYPAWSPDGRKIIFSSISGKLYVFDKIESKTYFIDSGSEPSWSDNSEFIVYSKILADNFSFSGSDIFISGYKGSNIKNLTNTSDINEMGAVFDSNKIIFHTYNKREIYSAFLNFNKSALNNKTIIAAHSENLEIKYYEINKTAKAETRVPGTVPYVHQVYDTPEWHYGYGSCAPTTAIMAVAYFNKLPKWPTQTSNGIGTHNSDYGSYVADRYRFNEYYYQDVSATGGGEDSWGGYGYMWTGSYSPHSHMRQYMENHYLTSVQEDADNWTKATTQINNGYPFPVCNLLTTAGHLTLGIGYIQGQHTMIFNDPYGNKNNPGYPNANGVDSYYDWPSYNNGYVNLNTVAWTVTAEGSEVAYNDTIIDDIFYNHGFYINNSQNTSTQRYFHDQNAGYNNHFWFTGSVDNSTDICYVTWTPNIPQTENYEVFAYLPGGTNANAQNAQYKIFYNGGQSLVVVNQSLYSGQWVSLGTYNFLQGQAGYVYLGDSTGVASENLAWDAMKFSKVAPVINLPIAGFVTSSQNVCQGDTIYYFNTSTNATSYQWLFVGGMPSQSNNENPVVVYNSDGIYDVELIASGQGESDTVIQNSVINVNPQTQALFNTNVISGTAPLTVLFSNTSTNSEGYVWYLGEGNLLTDVNPYHIYNIVGDFNVMLVSLNSYCGNDTAFITIHIDPIVGIEKSFLNNNNLAVFSNPLTQQTDIEYEIAEAGKVHLVLYDLLGKEISVPVNSDQISGKYRIYVNNAELSSGIYFCKLVVTSKISQWQLTKQMRIIK